MTLAIDTPGSKHNITGARQAYYDKISKYHLTPLWEVLKGLVTPEPKTQMLPALWKFPEVEKLMLEAGDVITAEEAERRVLVLENPGEPGKSRITNSLFAGIQLICPARSRTHTSTSLPPFASCSRAREPTRRSRARKLRWSMATSSSQQTGRHTTTATRAKSR